MTDKAQLNKNLEFQIKCGQDFLNHGNLAEAKEAYLRAGRIAVNLVTVSSGNDRIAFYKKATRISAIVEEIDLKLPKKTDSEKPMTNGGEETEDSIFTVESNVGVNFSDVIGCEDIKKYVSTEWIKRFDPKYKVAFTGKYATPMERGMLLYGLPGAGKTTMARAIAGEVKAAFYNVKASQISSKYVGDTEKAVAALFDEASRQERAIIYIDEIDGILAAPKPDSPNHEKSALNEWLRQMDGFDKKKVANVICIGATNFPNDIVASALRSGRLGAHFRVDLPNLRLRKQIINSRMDESLFEKDVRLDDIAARLAGYTTSDIIEYCNRLINISREAVISNIERGENKAALISSKDIEDFFEGAHSSISKKSLATIAQFESDLQIRNKNGSVYDYMQTLINECK